MIFATAGTVDVGAIDNLTALSAIAKAHKIWLHVDGAYGALGVLSSCVKPLLHGIELVDSIAFDFHKWGQVCTFFEFSTDLLCCDICFCLFDHISRYPMMLACCWLATPI